ncbi:MULTISPECIES: TPM domain-containing protein [unclassified Caulobacter]|uniref:TPM domain-containing protein n=1 Tax=unclassified Caulobacter TaxID=2648921 RepID=UPI0004A72E95|nr:TPM domain-containing protein [Caulobacter sp. UNC358MFTsu5.1]
MHTLSQTDQERIAKAVAEAEKTTAGEIYCVLAPEVGDDRAVPLIWAASAALLLPALALLAGFRPEMLSRLFGGWSVGHEAAHDVAILSALLTYVGLQAAIFAVTAALVSIPAVRRGLIPGPVKTARVRHAAMDYFLAKDLHLTRERTGVLIFAALAEHRVEVIADAGIHAAAPAAVWDAVVADLVAGLKRGAVADGFVAAIARTGAILAAHVPPRPGDVNELPDGLTVLPR